MIYECKNSEFENCGRKVDLKDCYNLLGVQYLFMAFQFFSKIILEFKDLCPVSFFFKASVDIFRTRLLHYLNNKYYKLLIVTIFPGPFLVEI